MNKEAFKIIQELYGISEEDIRKRKEEIELLNRQCNIDNHIDFNFKTEPNKFDGGLMGLEYCIYYCEECETDFAVRLSSDVVCCPSCKNENNIIRGDVQDFC